MYIFDQDMRSLLCSFDPGDVRLNHRSRFIVMRNPVLDHYIVAKPNITAGLSSA